MTKRPDDDASTALIGRASPVTVHVNGEARQTVAATLADLIAEMSYGAARVATALNGDFVAAKARASTPLQAGDRVEIVAPRQGG